MATKTVINSNATTTRGISITIDQAQQQQQHTDCISSATSKIAISPNISTAYSANDVGQRHQRCNNGNKLETNLTNTTRYSTTFIDINRNEDDDQNTKTGRTTRPKQQNIVEKESTTMSTFSQQMKPTTATTTATTSSQEPVNNSTETPLIVLSERRKTKVNEEEEGEAMKKAEATTTNGLGKVASNFDDDQCISISHIGGGNGTDVGICITHEQYHTESTKLTKHDNDDDDVLTTTTTTVIACNNNNNDDEQQHEHHERYDHRVLNEHHKDIINDNDDDDVVESCLGDGGSSSSSGEYFSNISVGANNGSCLTVAAAAAPNSPFLAQLENNIVAAHNTTKRLEIEIDPDCASALTETLTNADQPNSLVVKIKISPNEHNDDDGKENTITTVVSSVSENTLSCENKSKVTVVQLNSNAAAVQKTPPQLKLKILEDKMVQKPCAAQNGQSNGNTTNGNTTITELNVPPNQSSSPSSSYLYYMMSSGQFSPCDTLDSGTGSDLECNVVSNSPPPPPAKMQNNSTAPKLELHLKTTKIRVNTAAPNGSAATTNKDKPLKAVVDKTNEHLRAGSLTDSEESESSLSCDSLNSSEFLRLHSNSPSVAAPATPIGKSNGTFLPDSLLRDIRDRKYPTNDFVSKYVDNNNPTIYECVVVEPQTPTPTTPLPTTLNFAAVQEAVAHAKYVRERNNSNLFSTKRASMPKKTFVLNASDGSFVDTKMNSMPRKYEADKYYNFHVNEHENFRSFGNGSIGNGNSADLSDNGGDGCSEAGSWTDYESKSLSSNDDAFAGYKDIRCNSAASTIRSSKGTVRGVKNRVRNGIATFLQLQQPNVKNYKEKDLGKVVLYTTSMGIIRETFAKCSNVRQILRTLLVKFEERDVFMSVEYQQEIKERMHSEAIKVPQLFVEGQHIGDAETVERLNESGELRQLLKPYKSIATTYTCQTCGGYRLLPCPSCNGSKKSVHRNHFTAEFVALKCMNCDEVGLVKCHNC